MAALDAGEISCYTAYGKELWVSRGALAVIVGFRRRLYDPASAYFVPPDAMMRVAYMPQPIADTSHPLQQTYLASARNFADFLAALQAEMPPRPFDLHVNNTASQDKPLRRLVDEDAIAFHTSQSGWWINSAEASAFLPAGESFDDPDSTWFVDPHDWADHDEVERLVAEHRQHWPEIYGPADEAIAA
jgi:hypothetical protein